MATGAKSMTLVLFAGFVRAHPPFPPFGPPRSPSPDQPWSSPLIPSQLRDQWKQHPVLLSPAPEVFRRWRCSPPGPVFFFFPWSRLSLLGPHSTFILVLVCPSLTTYPALSPALFDREVAFPVRFFAHSSDRQQFATGTSCVFFHNSSGVPSAEKLTFPPSGLTARLFLFFSFLVFLPGPTF